VPWKITWIRFPGPTNDGQFSEEVGYDKGHRQDGTRLDNYSEYSEGKVMQSAKQDAINTIQQLPDNADTEEMIYRLYVLENIRRGRLDATSHDG